MKLHSSPDMRASTINSLIPVTDAISMILAGSALAIAGPEGALDKLPAGNWIGGTTPYFMTDGGGKIVTDNEVFVTNLSIIGDVAITQYAAESLDRISKDAPDNGFAMAIMPALSDCHKRFALEAPFYADAFLKPTVGWIAGFNVETGGQGKVYDGRGPIKCDNRAVVAHVTWRDNSLARLEIINPFQIGNGDVLTFEHAGITQTHCLVNGAKHNFSAYLADHSLNDMRRPLIGDYGGARINVAIQHIDHESGLVRLYAPTFPDVEYRFAAPLSDYSAAFRTALGEKADETALWSCNCVLNFLLGELEGKTIGGIAGPVTFGEIAYQLMTQTMVVLHRV